MNKTINIGWEVIIKNNNRKWIFRVFLGFKQENNYGILLDWDDELTYFNKEDIIKGC